MLSLVSIAPPHALLVAYWGKDGGAVLSLPTREYFQSSGWVEDRPDNLPSTNMKSNRSNNRRGADDAQSVRSGSDFWADGRSRTPSSQGFTASSSNYMSETGDEQNYGQYKQYQRMRTHLRHNRRANTNSQYTTADDDEDDDNDSQRTETPQNSEEIVDEIGAQDAFISGMIFALSRRLCPGLPYTPAWSGEDMSDSSGEDVYGRWKLDECLR